MNDQQDKSQVVADAHTPQSVADVCGCCGREPYIFLRHPAVEAYKGMVETWHPTCQEEYYRFLENADDVNRHEMDRFGGAYGLVTWEERTPEEHAAIRKATQP